ncbi:MAG: aldehyde dehydrogenase family protein [Candidatus Bipolaricaulia bacterium]
MKKEVMEMFVDGQWIESETGETFESISPATGETIATLPLGSQRDAQKAVQAARRDQPELAKMTAFERGELCHRIAEEIENERDSLTCWLAMDQGKPYKTEARLEVDQTIRHFKEAAEDVTRLETPVLQSRDPHKRIFLIRQPRGVYGVITPWNFPLAIPVEYLSAALATGNAVVWNPASTTSAIAVKLAECLERALQRDGVPPGVFNLVTGKGSVVGDTLVTSEGVDAIGLTGSPEVGEQVARRAGLKNLLLELGGNGPVIVLDDADVEEAAKAIAFGAFYCAGQVCVASERILVHEAVYDEFIDHLVEETCKVKLGPSLDEETTMGPLNNSEVADKMDRHIQDAVEKGAKVIYGGERAPGFPTDLYYQPTVLVDVPRDSLVNREETFGPIAPVMTFKSYEEALEITNEIDLGLLASVFTSSLKNAFYFSEKIQTGAVNINETSDYWEIHTPVGGYSGKKSGIGRIGGRWTIEEMTQLKTISMDIAKVKG